MSPLRWASLPVLLLACDPPPAEPQHTAPSPQASAEPAPLTVWTQTNDARADAGLPAEVLRPDRPLDPDNLSAPVAGRETLSGLHVDYTYSLQPGPKRSQPVQANLEFTKTTLARMQQRWAVDLSGSRLRVVLLGPMLLPEGVELRARADRIGNLALHAPSASYRPLPPGTLRSFFDEGRFDRAPLLEATTRELEEGQQFGVRTRRTEVQTLEGQLTVELVRLAEDPTLALAKERLEVGPMFCRLLLDFIHAAPDALDCAGDELAIRAEIAPRGRADRIVLAAEAWPRRSEIALGALHVPPASSRFQGRVWQPFASRVFLSDGEQAQLRLGPEPITLEPNTEPLNGLLLHNHRRRPLWLALDGVVVAWVGASSSVLLRGLQRGYYQAEWFSALGDLREPPVMVTVPGRSETGTRPIEPQRH